MFRSIALAVVLAASTSTASADHVYAPAYDLGDPQVEPRERLQPAVTCYPVNYITRDAQGNVVAVQVTRRCFDREGRPVEPPQR